MTWRGFAPRLCVVVAAIAIAIVFSWPLPLHLRSGLLGQVSGDTGVYVWNQWIFHYELSQGRNPFITDQILSLTAPVDLSQHNYTPFLNALALPLIPLVGAVAAFNIVFLLITVITALATYRLVRRVTDANRSVAWLAGVLFAWSPVLVARSTGHMSLVAAAPLPVFMLCLLNAEQSRRSGWAALVGLSVAWAAFCDAYFAVYCLMIGAGFVGLRLAAVRRADVGPSRSWAWAVNILLVSTAGLVGGLLLGQGGEFAVAGRAVRVRGLYTPLLVLTALVLIRLSLGLRLQARAHASITARRLVKVAMIAGLACVGPLSPVLYGLGRRMFDGRFVSPPTFWRSSPRGVDLLGLLDANPNHALVRSVRDLQSLDPTAFVDYTASLSILAVVLVIVAIWRGYRPSFGWLSLTIGFALLALGPFVIVAGYDTHVPGPWSLLRYVPVVSLARSPARFAIVAALGLAVLFAGALQSLVTRSTRPRAIVWCVGAALIFELCPVPRTLYSAEIPGIYRRIAADPRPVRVLELPLGVRDGVSSVGDFTARSQFFQTLHAKKLIGGYLSRISPRRIDDMRRQPTLSALLALSGGHELAESESRAVRARAPRFLEQSNLGYVVIDHARASPGLVTLVVDAWRLEEIERTGALVLYRPTLLERHVTP